MITGTFLGTGGSRGPNGLINGDLDITNPLNRRTSPAFFLDIDGFKILIDCGPEVAFQMERCNLQEGIDLALLTHDHGDHSDGLRFLHAVFDHFNGENPIPIYYDQFFDLRIKAKFPFLFTKEECPDLPFSISEYYGALASMPSLDAIKAPIQIKARRVKHGAEFSLAYRFGDKLLYISDVSELTDEDVVALQGAHTVIIDGNGFETAHGHMSIPDVVKIIQRLNPQMAFLTHLSQKVDYSDAMAYLQDHSRNIPILPAYDGLQIQFGEEKPVFNLSHDPYTGDLRTLALARRNSISR